MTNARGDVPYSWDLIEDQLREAIVAQASILYAFGPLDGLADKYLGFPLNDDPAEMGPADREKIDLSRFAIHNHARVAYGYAYQVEPVDTDTAISSWHEVDGLLQGFPETDANGEPSPFCTMNDFPLRRMFETFFARIALLEQDSDMTVRQLALLSNMTVQAVRNSLSKEGYKLEKTQGSSRSRLDDPSFKLAALDARDWLSRRRGFVPAADARALNLAKLFQPGGNDFPTALAKGVSAVAPAREIAARAGVDEDWLLSLLDGRKVELEIRALQSLASVLELPEPRFVAAGVEHILSL